MTYSVAQSYRAYLTMGDEAESPVPERLRFHIPDEEAAGAAGGSHAHHGPNAISKRPPLAHQSTAISEDSLSIRPGSGRGSIATEPAAILPIQYRTL